MTAQSPTPASERIANGIKAMGATLNYWLGRSSLSHDQMAAIAAWAIGEAGLVENTTLSRARNGKLPYGMSIRALLALGAANEAIWRWQVQGADAAINRFGPFQAWGVREGNVNGAIWLHHPDHPDEPLTFADLCELQAGLLELPYLPGHVLSPTSARERSDRLSELLNQVIADAGLKPRDGLVALTAAYPVADTRRQNRLMDLVIGKTALGPGEMERELLAIAEAIRVMRRLPPGSYGASELHAELRG
jgi:hypothetical protein